MKLRVHAFALAIGLSLAAVKSFAQGDIIAQLQPGVDPAVLQGLFPIELLDATAGAPFALYDVLPGFDVNAVQAAMLARPDLVVFSEDQIEVEAPENKGAGKGGTIGAVFDPGAVYEENDGLLRQINYRRTISGFRGRGVNVGLLDTGIAATNMHLRTRVVKGVAIATDRQDWLDRPSGADTNGNGEPDEAVGHGSMVAGVVMQLAPEARFVVARVADSEGYSSAWWVLKGIVFACNNNVEVINISLGAIGDVPALSEVIERWAEPQGVIVVAPVGNNAASSANYPARFNHVVAVAGVDPLDIKAPFSNWDPKTRQSAPATGVKSTWWDNTIGVWSGTSFAAPMVAAVLADGLQWRPRLTFLEVDRLRDLTQSVGDDIDSMNPGHAGELGLRLNAWNLKQAVIRM